MIKKTKPLRKRGGFLWVLLQKLGSHLAPSDEGDSSRCEEMSRSDRGDRRRQRLASKARLRERKSCIFLQLYTFSPSVTAKPCHLPRQREARIVETPTFRIEPFFRAVIRNCCYYCCSCSDCYSGCFYSDCCSCSGYYSGCCSGYSCSGCFPLKITPLSGLLSVKAG